MKLHVDLAVLLLAILVFRLRPSSGPHTSNSVLATSVLVFVLGLLLAATPAGANVLGTVRQVAATLP